MPNSRPPKCPVCGAPPLAATAPFCSRGCRDRDLLKWLGEDYRVPGRPVDPQAEKSGDYGVDSQGD